MKNLRPFPYKYDDHKTNKPGTHITIAIRFNINLWNEKQYVHYITWPSFRQRFENNSQLDYSLIKLGWTISFTGIGICLCPSVSVDRTVLLLPKTTNNYIKRQATPSRCSLKQWETQTQEASKTKNHWDKYIKSTDHWALLGPRATLSCEAQISNLCKSWWCYLVSSEPNHTLPNPVLNAEFAFSCKPCTYSEPQWPLSLINTNQAGYVTW